jgi:hypothetical protein
MMMDTPMIYSPYPNELTTMYAYHFNARHAQLNEQLHNRSLSVFFAVILLKGGGVKLY